MAMSDTAFDEFFKRALKHEGKVCEDVPGDNGGPTKWGITIGRLATMKRVKEPKRGTDAFEKLKAELFELTEHEIKTIYRKDYWDAVRGDDLPPGLNYAVADFGLNSGPSRGVKALQKIVGNPQTGRMDDETIAEAKAFEPVEIIMRYSDERKRFLNAIVGNNPRQAKFQKGWLARVGDVQRAAIKDCEKVVSIEPPKPAPMPKAEPVQPDQPTVMQTAKRSWSIKLILAGIAATLEKIFNFFTSFLPDAASEVEAVADPISSLGSMLKLNMAGILGSVTIVVLIIVLFRHLRDKRELETLKGDVGEPATAKEV
jgi:lysozyme family protein